MFALVLTLLLGTSLHAPRQEDPAALWNAGRRSEALSAWSERLEREPGDLALRRRLAEAQLAVHHYAGALATLAPLGGEVDGLRALADYRLGHWQAALERLNGGDADQVIMRIEALEALGRTDEAEREVARAALLLGDEDPRVLGYRARALSRAGQDAAAVPLFERALELDPWDSTALFGLGRALVGCGRREEGLARLEEHRALVPRLDALDFAQRSVDLAPLHAPGHAAVGDAQRELGRIELAKACYERGLELASPAELVPISLRLARLLYEDLAQLDAAVALLENAGTRSGDPRPWVRAGDLLHAAGRSLDAVQRYYQARELRPDDAQIAARIEAARGAYRKDSDH